MKPIIYFKKIFLAVITLAFLACNNNDQTGELKITDGETIKIKKDKTTSISGTLDDIEISVKEFKDSCADIRIIGRTFLTTEYFVGSICCKDTVFINYHKTPYYIFFKEINDYLFGRDNLNFEVGRIGVPKTNKQNHLTSNIEQKVIEFLSSLEKSNFTFIRNGSNHTAKEAADHLRNKFNSQKSEINSFDEFINKIASKSSFTGEEYKIIINGNTMILEEWIRNEYLKIK